MNLLSVTNILLSLKIERNGLCNDGLISLIMKSNFTYTKIGVECL